MIKYDSIKLEDLWYFVGLIATDGCLSKDGRHVDITSSEEEFLGRLRVRLGISNRVGHKRNGAGMIQSRIQFAGSGFYDFLLSIGLMPRKSLKLGQIAVDRTYFGDFLRGVIDGDGSIRSWRHPGNGGVQWSLRIYSAAREFVFWLQQEIDEVWRTKGIIHRDRNLYVLKFGKMAAQRVLKDCYYKNCLSLERKEKLASQCVSAANGWSRSKTIGQVAEWQTLRTQKWVSLAATLG